jgi:catechol 2,3-dioxygenase-like lactoylglutathione lyase family enzyme
MHPTGVVANLSVADLAETRDFYADFLGLGVEDSTWAGSSTCNLQTAARSSS